MFSDSAVQAQPAHRAGAETVNDFSIQVATVNGSGSQTANLVLIRSLFQMGIPVSGKNLFPSNIAGLPTWYTIRANKHGYIGRKKEIDLLVAMNPETAREDVLALDAGAAVVYDEPLKLNQVRADLVFYPVPFDELVKPICPDAKLRRLVRNMIYDGVLSKLLGVEMAEMEKALGRQLGKKAKAVALNQAALAAGYAYAEQHLPKRDALRAERMDKTRGKILIEANAAVAIGAMMAGVTVVTWYPITPSSTVVETLIDYMKKYRLDKETGKATFAIVQAEDELASIGMALGAGWAGARSMTATSGPGISLMAEFTGLGLLHRSARGHRRRAARRTVDRSADAHGAGGHPLDGRAVARRHQAHHAHPELGRGVLRADDEGVRPGGAVPDAGVRDDRPRPRHEHLDGRLVHVSRQAARSRQAPRRGDAEDAGRLGPVRGRGRRRHRLAHRARRRPARVYFNRGSGHNAKGQYSERADDYTANVDRLAKKFETARTVGPG